MGKTDTHHACDGRNGNVPSDITGRVRHRSFRAFPFVPAFAIAALAFLLAGCKTMSDPDGTDIPWAGPAPWEGVPNIPLQR